MKKYLLVVFIILIGIKTMAQNTFPASGNVGIGTTSPAYSLQVNGTGNFTGALSGTTSMFSGQVNAGVSTLGHIIITGPNSSTNSGYIQFYKGDGTTRLGYIGYDNTNISYNAEGGAIHVFNGAAIFNSTLSLGTGNATPTSKLNAWTNNANVAGLSISNWYGGVTSYGPKITFDNSTFGDWALGSSDGSNRFEISRTWGTPDFSINSSGATTLSGSLSGTSATFSEQVNAGVSTLGHITITGPNSSTNSGYIQFYKGDGTTRLGYIGYDNTNISYSAEGGATHVFNGAAIFNSTLSLGTGNATSTSKLNAWTNNANVAGLSISNWYGGVTAYGPKITFDNSTFGDWALGSSDGSNRFEISRTWGTPDFSINSSGATTLSGSLSGTSATFSGNVGIGTSNSGIYKLAVEGTLGARKIKVTQASSWSDYVFDSSYQLKPLTEIEQFIKINKHLPDVPTAKQVEKEGIDVGDNQALLLKKIEELTLYMIEIKKENELQHKKITELEMRFVERFK